ncbi:ABC transporter ATP-binding protein [Bradyrhizobium sp. USDA 4504]
MSSEIVIEARGLGKVYLVYTKPQDRLKQMILRWKNYYQKYWAVQNVDLTIRRGETVGIIGRNGSGKSTLLQMIAGTLQPNAGSLAVNGRVAPLLELGAGFNPEFTGRENVHLAGSILGLTSDEVEKRYDAIVKFAGIGDFINQPVKTYSSGMYARLAFAVAAHVDADILIIDEILSVGDIAFQNKCMARLNLMREKGVTILFVSHDLSTLQMICDRAIWMDGGNIQLTGDPVAVSQEYHAFATGALNDRSAFGGRSEDAPPAITLQAASHIPQHVTAHGRFVEFKLRSNGRHTFEVHEDLSLDFALQAQEYLAGAIFAVSIYRKDGDWVIGQTSADEHVQAGEMQSGEIKRVTLTLKRLVLSPGDYVACVAAYSTDLTLCYAMTELNVMFKVRSNFTTWGKVLHPIEWVVYE